MLFVTSGRVYEIPVQTIEHWSTTNREINIESISFFNEVELLELEVVNGRLSMDQFIDKMHSDVMTKKSTSLLRKIFLDLKLTLGDADFDSLYLTSHRPQEVEEYLLHESTESGYDLDRLIILECAQCRGLPIPEEYLDPETGESVAPEWIGTRQHKIH